MPMHDIIVVGGSAGSIETLGKIVGELPAGMSAAIFVVVHTHPTSPGYLPFILERFGVLPATYARNGDAIKFDHISVAPPDHHLLIEDGHVRLTKGPKENRSRPAIDPLFRSAAYFYGPRVIGVVLSGMLDDGTAGLWTIKDRGGLAVVQLPDDAQYPSMPENALRNVAVDHQAPAHELGPLIARLAREPAAEPYLPPVSGRLKAETRIAMEDSALEEGILDLGELSPFTCPECHGVMVQLHEGGLMRFRCHTGHAFTANSLLAELSESIEDSIWSTMRAMEERALLLSHLARHLDERGDPATAARFAAKAHAANLWAQQVKQLALQHEQLSEDQVRGEG